MSKRTPSLEEKRHSLAHILAQAVLDMFPEAKLGVGPAIENGFYYDFELPRTLIPEDLAILEKKMKHIIKQNQEFTSKVEPVDAAIDFLKEIGQPYKIELAEGFKADGIEEVGFHRNGPFVDLCRGGHINSTNQIDPKAFKLDRIAGAYWKGDEKNPMLQRVYGLAFESGQELEDYLEMRREAEKRDHRKLGMELDLFTFSELVGSGLPLFTPRGTQMRRDLEEFVQSLQEPLGYQRVQIPHITKKDLYETSGHWEKFKDDLFHVLGAHEELFAMKPMNCPHHTQIYASRSRSYRDLPIRYSEVTMCYRNEQKGELHGLSRVRALTQDDAHVFCRPDQIMEEAMKIYGMIEKFYSVMGMELKVRFSTHDPKAPEKYLGGKEVWKNAEERLKEVLDKIGPKEVLDGVGEAAFYGPKLDFMAYDGLGREWQLATIQLDFNLPQRFELEYIDNDGEPKRPIMIHRAILGSVERFMSIVIEHFGGAFPAWLAPVQTAVIPVNSAHDDYATKVYEELKEAGIRVEFLDAEDSLGKRIRNSEKQKIPYMLVIGDNEVKNKSVTVRDYATKEQKEHKKDAFLKSLLEEIRERRLSV